MGRINDVTAKGLSIAECDEIALNSAGVVDSMGYGWDRPLGGDVNEEYSSKVVNTQGMGNHGEIVLVGKSPRARALLRRGKAAALIAVGIRPFVAAACVSQRYGMEVEVAKMADDLVELVAISDFYGNSHKEFKIWCGITEYTLSFPRVCAAIAIAAKAVEKR